MHPAWLVLQVTVLKNLRMVDEGAMAPVASPDELHMDMLAQVCMHVLTWAVAWHECLN